MEIYKSLACVIQQVKEKTPLVHHITNYVTANDCANIVLSLGGSPIMADAIEEVENMTSISHALVLNMGTLNQRTIESMKKAGQIANKHNIPVVFDPVGIGATPYRYECAKDLLDHVHMDIIRGNMSEVKCLAGLKTKSLGVDSMDDDVAGADIAKNLSRTLNSVVAITGKEDIISNGEQVCILSNGHVDLKNVTGTGCMSTSLIGTFVGALKNPFIACIAGVLCMGIAGEMAHDRMNDQDGFGSFKVYIMDAITNMTDECLMKKGRILNEQ